MNARDELKKLLEIAQKGGNDADIYLLDKIDKLSIEIEKAHENFEKEIQKILTLKKGEAGDRGLKGERGESIKGDSGKDGKDGKTPQKGTDYLTTEEISDIIERATEEAKSAQKPINVEEIALEISQKLPLYGTSIRDALELLQDDERLDKKAIKGLEEELNRIDSKPTRVMGRTGMNNWTHQSFTMNGSDTSVALTDAIGANGLGGFVYYNGNLLTRVTAYTVATSGKTINLLFTPDNGTVIDVIYQSMFRTI